MKIIQKPRCSGKTTELIYESSEKRIPILCPTTFMAHEVEDLAKELGLDIPEPTSVNKVVSQGRCMQKYLIDELKSCLLQLGIYPVAVTITEEMEVQEE